jgi:gallate dioxygenase
MAATSARKVVSFMLPMIATLITARYRACERSIFCVGAGLHRVRSVPRSSCMAKIIGGIAASHTPTIGFAFDRDKRGDPVWAPIFTAFDPVRQWLADHLPDVLVFIYNDHVTSFFFDHYSAFALGVGERWDVADEGGGARDLPAIGGDPAFAAHLGRSLMADEFDMSFFQDRALDHGCFSPLSMLCPHQTEVDVEGEAGWPVRLVPLQVGVLQFPIPSARRCWKLGQALRRAIESYPQDLRVAIVATGGLSHQVHGERAGFNNPAWDARFLDLFERDPEQLLDMTQAEYATLGGFEGAEVIMWLVMRGALAARVRCLHRSYYLPSMTGIATAVYEPVEQATPDTVLQRHRAHIGQQLAGAGELAGTYPFTLERSVKAYRLNRFLHDLVHPEHRARFLADEAACLLESGLDETERALVQRRDWRGLIHFGVIFFMLEKLGAVIGVSNLHIYAAMRGESLEDFQKTRNAPNALYSVAGKEAGAIGWDRVASPPARPLVIPCDPS